MPWIEHFKALSWVISPVTSLSEFPEPNVLWKFSPVTNGRVYCLSIVVHYRENLGIKVCKRFWSKLFKKNLLHTQFCSVVDLATWCCQRTTEKTKTPNLRFQLSIKTDQSTFWAKKSNFRFTMHNIALVEKIDITGNTIRVVKLAFCLRTQTAQCGSQQVLGTHWLSHMSTLHPHGFKSVGSHSCLSNTGKPCVGLGAGFHTRNPITIRRFTQGSEHNPCCIHFISLFFSEG